MVLICSDSHEACLREDKGAEVPVSTQVTVGSRIHVHYVKARLVAMHGVQYHLTMIALEKNTKKASQRSAFFFFCSGPAMLYFSVLRDKNMQDWPKREWLTCPLSSKRLLVSLRVSKDTVCFIHWPPQAGESGWKCILLGAMTSARPATNQDELWKAYLTHTHTHIVTKHLLW